MSSKYLLTKATLIQRIEEGEENAWVINSFYGCLKGDVTEPIASYHYERLTEEERKRLVKIPFKLLDDDGELYAKGLCSDEDSENAFEPLDFASSEWGCTDIQFKNKNGRWESL